MLHSVTPTGSCGVTRWGANSSTPSLCARQIQLLKQIYQFLATALTTVKHQSLDHLFPDHETFGPSNVWKNEKVPKFCRECQDKMYSFRNHARYLLYKFMWKHIIQNLQYRGRNGDVGTKHVLEYCETSIFDGIACTRYISLAFCCIILHFARNLRNFCFPGFKLSDQQTPGSINFGPTYSGQQSFGPTNYWTTLFSICPSHLPWLVKGITGRF
jgi:hypothetical protein